MTGILFQEWLHILDKRMTSKKRRILLILDNAPSHVMKDVHLKSVEICFLPPNATSRLQPMDQGIIAAFKKRFRTFQLEHALEKLDEINGDNTGNRHVDIYKVDILKAMRWCQNAWKDLSSTAIRNCWAHSGLLHQNAAPVCINSAQTENRKLDAALAAAMQRLAVNHLSIKDPIGLDAEIVQAPLDELDERDIIEMIQVEEAEQMLSIQPQVHRPRKLR